MKKKITVLMLVVLFVVGCSWQKTSAITYKSLGITLESTRVAAKDLCDTGVLSSEECENLKAQYNLARINYSLAGNMLISAIELDRNINENQYNSLIETVSYILGNINLVIEGNQ